MARSRWTQAERDAAVALAAEHGIAHAQHELGVPKQTLSRWCQQAGVRTVPPKQTANALAARKATSDERRGRLADRMLDLAEMATDQAAVLIAEAGLRDVVGAWTRAVHDHQLLSGQATGRVEHRDQIDAEIERLVSDMAET